MHGLTAMQIDYRYAPEIREKELSASGSHITLHHHGSLAAAYVYGLCRSGGFAAFTSRYLGFLHLRCIVPHW